LLVAVSRGWVDDPDSAVVWAGSHEGRWGIRMAQERRDFTTIWFDVGQRTLGLEAFLLPAPAHDAQEVYRQALVRNAGSWPVAIALDAHGDLVILGRVPLDELDARKLDELVGAVYELVEISFAAMVRAGFEAREKTR
jgi:hypothetical protein